MKKFIIFALLLLTTQISYAEREREMYKVTSESGVHARTEPTTKSGSVYTTIRHGEIIPVINIEDGWATTLYKSYGTKMLYVDVSKITLHKTYEQILADEKAKKEAEKAEKRKNWYNPKYWGFIGGVVRWLVIPIIVFSYIMSIPFKMIAKLRFINNFFFYCICYLLMFIMLPILASTLVLVGLYSGYGAFFGLLALGFVLGRTDIKSIIGWRCPSCRHSAARILDSYVSRVITTTTTYSKSGSVIDRSEHTDSTINYYQKCDICGREWWVYD